MAHFTFIKYWLVFSILLCVPALSHAQQYTKVNHVTGTQIIGGYSVKVQGVNTNAVNGWCGASPFHIGKNNNITDGYEFQITPPVSGIKLEMTASDHNEVIEVYLNGRFYSVNTNELSPYPGTCNANFRAFVQTGQIHFTGPTVALDAGTTVKIGNNVISTVRVMETGAYSGTVFSFYFVEDTLLSIDSLSDTTLCQGDSLHVKYWATKFLPGNKFILQLSDSAGSFASPILLDSTSSTVSGIFKTIVPKSIIAGTKYRVRVVSNFPVRTSADNGKNIVIKALPDKPFTASNSPLCTDSILNLGAVSGTLGVSYSWSGPGGFTSSSAAPVRTNVVSSWSGNYIVTVTHNGCTAKDTTAVVIHPVTPKPAAGSNTPVCAGGDINLSAAAITGTTYYWSGPGLYYAITQNAVRPNAILQDGGIYTVVATLNGCASVPDTTVVAVTQGPEVLAYPNPGDTICTGWNVNFVAIPKNAGSAPTYQWYKNGTATGATGSTYQATNVSDGDTFYVRMTAGTVCNTPISSKPIRITVLPVHTPPTINISATPGNHVWPYVAVTFKATTGNAGTNPGYQWKRNGTNISLAQDSILKMTDLKTGDTICCVVTSNFLCAVPREVQSNCIVMNIDLSIEGGKESESGKESAAVIYPNPSNGNFTIEVKEAGILYVSNIQGQLISRYTLKDGANTIALPPGIAEGVYLLRAVQHGESGSVNVDRIVIAR